MIDKSFLKRCTVSLQTLNQSTRRNILNRTLMAVVIGALILGTGVARSQPDGPPPPPRRGAPPPPPVDPLTATQDGAGAAIQRAYDAIGRSAALAESSRAEGSGDLLTQSRNAYQQALTAYQASNYTAAQEWGMMAADLARAADELASARLFASAQPKMNPPPQVTGGLDPAARVYDDLGRLAQHRADIAARIGATPDAADREVHNLLEEAGRLEQNAQNLLNSQKPQEAVSMARAADALLAACDHSIRRVLIASGRVAAPIPPPPGGPEPPPPPQP
jgi:hypothetical protein